MHIAIAGNIGAGKTTLTSLLAEHFDWTPHYEDVDRNPYLDDFYDNMEKWSFNLQIYFLGSRFSQVKKIRESGLPIIQDRTIHEDAHIFANNLADMGLLDYRDYQNYLTIFNLMNSLVQAPDLLIYLKASVPNLIRQIKKRGREYESSISVDYLTRLNQKYEQWISTYTQGEILVINVDDLDFVKNSEDLDFIYKNVEKKLKGLK